MQKDEGGGGSRFSTDSIYKKAWGSYSEQNKFTKNVWGSRFRTATNPEKGMGVAIPNYKVRKRHGGCNSKQLESSQNGLGVAIPNIIYFTECHGGRYSEQIK